MNRLLSIIKNSLHTIVAIVCITVVSLYVTTQLNLYGYIAQKAITNDMAEYLGTEVTVNDIDIDIFNQFVLNDITIKDQSNDTLLYARRAMVSFDFLPLLLRKLQIHTIQLIDFDINLNQKDSIEEPNYKFLIDVLAPRDKDNKRQLLSDININSIILRSGSISFDRQYKPYRDKLLDINHLDFHNLSSSLKLHSARNKGMELFVKRILFEEKSGLKVDKASANILYLPETSALHVKDIALHLQQEINNAPSAIVDIRSSFDYTRNSSNLKIENLHLEIPELVTGNIKAEMSDLFSKNLTPSVGGKIEKLVVTSKALDWINSETGKLPKALIDYKKENIESALLTCSYGGRIDSLNYNAEITVRGKTNAEIEGIGTLLNYTETRTDLKGNIHNIAYNGHSYNNLKIDGVLTNNDYVGKIVLQDNDVFLYSENRIGFGKQKSIKTDISFQQLNPYNMGVTQSFNLKNVDFTGKMHADLKTNGRKLPIGTLTIDSLMMSNDSVSLTIYDIEGLAEMKEDEYRANIKSNAFNFTYEHDELSKRIKGFLNEEEKLTDLFNLPFVIRQYANCNIEFDNYNNIEFAELHTPEIEVDNNHLKIDAAVYGDTDSLKHVTQLEYMRGDNNIQAVLLGTAKLDPLFVDIQPCKIQVNNSVMDCGGITLSKNSQNNYDIERFNLNYENQIIEAHGNISNTGAGDLAIHIENLGLDTIFSLLNSKYIDFGGIGTGDIIFSNDSVKHVYSDNLYIKDFSYMNGILGNTNLKAFFDINRKKLNLEALVGNDEEKYSRLEGNVVLGKIDSLDLMIDADKLNVNFLKYWLDDFLEEFKGNITGMVHLYGPVKQLNLVGSPYAEASFTNHLIGTVINYQDYIDLKSIEENEIGEISIKNGRFFDRFGNVGFANASIRHRQLMKYNYDVKADMPDDINGFLLFDNPSHDNNEMYWGQLFTSGTAVLRGGDGRHKIDVSCRTVAKSQFNLSPGEETYSDNGYSFLTFRDKRAFEDSENDIYIIDNLIKNNSQTSTLNIEVDIQAQATENCNVYVQMDPLAEDRLVCKGNGNISIHYDPRHDITIGGDYNITSGSYLITMRGDLMSKEFQIQNGSHVTFPGSFSNAELNLNAVYGIPSVNLRDLDESFATMASMNRTTLPVDCKLTVTGQLSAPQITFDLEVKNTSDDVQALVHNLIGTQEMLNREVFYLLLFNKFYTPEYASTSQNNSGSELTSFASASLTSQLNSVLGHLSDNFALGTNFRSDKGDFSDMEMDLSLSTRLLGDRLILNGNLGYRDPSNRVGMSNNTNSFIGDFDVEYLVNTTGTIRAKAYSHYNERDYSINNALTTQGIGFILRKDFKSLKDLLFLSKYNIINKNK